MNYRYFTSESVAAGHPDKICDQISDTIVDRAIEVYSKSRVAVETLVTRNRVIIAGEITCPEKLDYEGFLSPLVLYRFAQYMHKHRKQSNGELRLSDNWQKGIPKNEYMKSLWRHEMDAWAIHRGYQVYKEKVGNGEVTHIVSKNQINKYPGWIPVTLEEALCGIIFNSSGYLHELMNEEKIGGEKVCKEK